MRAERSLPLGEVQGYARWRLFWSSAMHEELKLGWLGWAAARVEEWLAAGTLVYLDAFDTLILKETRGLVRALKTSRSPSLASAGLA